jgi:hypothetical protein
LSGELIMGLFASVAVGASLGLIGALVGMGIPEYEAKRYEGKVKVGGVLLSVHCNSPQHARRTFETLLGEAGHAHVTVRLTGAGCVSEQLIFEG